MSHLSKKLKDLRESAGYKVEYMASHLKIAPSTYYSYESGVREPSFAILTEIARLYSVSTDYLLGVESDNTSHLKVLTNSLSKDQLSKVEQYIEYLHWKSNGKKFI
jgi:transcriptional regulator with XRE-family HTH domain